MVTSCPLSTPTVFTVTVPELYSTAFNTAPQEKALVPIALMRAVVSTKKDELVTCMAATPAASDTSAVNVYGP